VAAASKGSLVSFSDEDVLRSLNISPAVLAENARFGSWWISNKPSLDESGNLALIPYGGKMLIFMSGGYVQRLSKALTIVRSLARRLSFGMWFSESSRSGTVVLRNHPYSAELTNTGETSCEEL
jgi:hypothetical protein